jgi:hypothetical protein
MGQLEVSMSKLLTTVSAIGLLAMIAAPGAASASEHAGASMKTSNSIEVSSARRHYRTYRHYSYRPHYRHYRNYGYYGGYGGYNSYAYDPYYRPYYRPGFSVGVGPFGFGFGF